MKFKEILQYITIHPDTEYFMFMTEGNEDIYAKPGLYNVMFDKTLEHIIKEEGEPFKFTGVLVIQYNKDKQQIMESYLGTKLKKVWMDTFFSMKMVNMLVVQDMNTPMKGKFIISI